MRTAIPTLLFISILAHATDPFAGVEKETVPVTDNIYMLVGPRGNIGVSDGEDGILMVDDQCKPLADRIKAALAEINKGAPTIVLNTHYHGDHTGRNIAFGKDSIIMAHKNARIRLVNGDTQGTFPEHALPMVTYTEAASIRFNGEEVALIQTGHSHTDGDTMVHFTESNMIHMGDNLFKGMFPYIDLNAGGSIDGFIATTQQVIDMSSNETKIIPGHGKLASRAD
jgi:glyoxylase-like metal-dependent hydrolase (beta-lactamase superfamily II)